MANATRFQFRIDGRGAGPVRDKWDDAAQDAVSAGYATWGRAFDMIYLDDSQGAEIARV